MAHKVITNLEGQWKNEIGSILTINEINPQTGYFTGYYQTNDSIPNEAGEKIPFTKEWPLQGTASGDIVSFIVDYSEDNPNIGTWLGHFGNDARQLHTQWLLGSTTLKRKNSTKEPTPLWAATRIGRDVFIKQ